MARRAKAGDPSAVEAFVARMGCIRPLLAYKNAQLGGRLGPAELEDTVQDTLIAVWRKLGEYRGDGSLAAWAYRFGFLELMNRLRKLERLPKLLDDLDADRVPEPEARPRPDVLELEHLYRVLDRLGPPDADIIRLRFLEELSFDEIGPRLALPPNTAKTRFYRAMKKLKTLLEPRREDAVASWSEP